MRRLVSMVLLAALSLLPNTAKTCASFSLSVSKSAVMGRNYDWYQDHGYAIINPKHVSKKAILLNASSSRPATWTSQYGSVTFNQHGRELPLGGINEKGLSVEVLWLGETSYPSVASNASINELQWVQYQLDNFSSVSEVLSALGNVNIQKVFAPLHYFMCDATGACAVVEFVNKQKMVHSTLTKNLPLPLITNSTYESSFGYLKNFVGFGGVKPLPKSLESRDRFVVLANQIRTATIAATDPVSYAFRSLAKIAPPPDYPVSNQFQIVYETSRQVVHFQTQKNPGVKTVDLNRLELSCKHPARFLDMNAVAPGNVSSSFRELDYHDNRALVDMGFAVIEGVIPALPAEQIDAIAQYPDQLRCTER